MCVFSCDLGIIDTARMVIFTDMSDDRLLAFLAARNKIYRDQSVRQRKQNLENDLTRSMKRGFSAHKPGAKM